MRAAQEEQWVAKQQIEEQIAFFEDRFWFGEEGDDSMEKKEVTFQREKLYEEIWQLSLSKVAKKYNVPYQKLKDACKEADIPLPSQSYWTNLYIGNSVQKEPLPESSRTIVTVSFFVRTIPSASSGTQTQIQNCCNEKENDTIIVSKSTATETLPSKPAFDENLHKREILYDKVWEHPVTEVAKHYGVTEMMINKVCKMLNVPVPPRGFWVENAAGKPVARESLPKYTDQTLGYDKKSDDNSDENLKFLEEEERLRVIMTALQLQVDPNKRKLHPVLIRHKAEYAVWSKSNPREPYAAWNREAYRRIPSGEPPLYEKVSENMLPRLYHILDTLYCAIEKLGGSINQDLSVQIHGEHVMFMVSEGQKQTKHVLTKEELKQLEQYEKEKQKYKYASEPKFRKYDYLPTGRLTFSAYTGSFIRDLSDIGLENRVGELLLILYTASEKVRVEREAREEAKRKAEEEARKKELQRQQYNTEIDRLTTLKNEAEDYQTACKIRAYVAAVESKPNLDQSQLEWIAWAKAKADWYDPTIEKDDPILGKRDHNNQDDPKKKGLHWW